MKLNIKELSIRNFRSFGDKPAILNLNKLGPTLIVGQYGDDETKSNGCGKTTLIDAVIWCLFGRTPSRAKTGDHIINNINKKDCVVSIKTSDGYIITRTRNLDGHNDLLIFEPNGLEVKDISDSTNNNAQKHINRLFNLDYEIFTSSMFFTQSGGSFMSMSDIKRKKALERMLNLTRYDMYALVAKEKITNLEKQQASIIGQKNQIDINILSSTLRLDKIFKEQEIYFLSKEKRINETKEKFEQVESEFKNKKRTITENIVVIKTQLESMLLYDITQLTTQWGKHDDLKNKINDNQSKIKNLENEIFRLETEQNSLKNNTTINYDKTIQEFEQKISELKNQLTDKINLNNLQKEWDIYNLKLLENNERTSIIDKSISNYRSKIELLLEDKKEWEDRKGTTCQSCKQTITEEHVSLLTTSDIDKINDLKIKLNEILNVKKEFKTEIQTPTYSKKEAQFFNQKIESVEHDIRYFTKSLEDAKKSKLDSDSYFKNKNIRLIEIQAFFSKHKNSITKLIEENNENIKNLIAPELTVSEAKLTRENYNFKSIEIDKLNDSIVELNKNLRLQNDDIKKSIENIENEIDPYNKTIEDIKEELKIIKNDKLKIEAEIQVFDDDINHLDYIRSAYSDRKKIKAYVLSSLIPYFNRRINYYADAFECNFGIEFNSFLQLKSELWPYDLWSGGEKTRINIAIHFAIYDLHQSIYGPQCNLLVFDEVDQPLDAYGVNCLAELLFRDFVGEDIHKPDTILVISHKTAMKDMFPSKIIVNKENGFSRIDEIRS